MTNRKMISAIALALSLVPAAAQAADTDNYWSANAAGCVPEDAAIQGDLYSTTSGGAVQHDSGDSGSFYVDCDVPKNSGGTNPGKLFLTYDDDSSSGFVEAQLYRMSRSTGTVTSFSTVTSTNNGGTTSESSSSFSHTFVQNTHSYFVRIQVQRTGTTPLEVFYSVALGT